MKHCIMTTSNQLDTYLPHINYAKVLKEQGNEVYLYYNGKKNFTDENGIIFRGIKLSRFNPLRTLTAAIKYFRAALKLHAAVYTFFNPEIVLTAKWLSSIKARVVYVLPPNPYFGYGKERRTKFIDKIEQKAVPMFNAVITSSPPDFSSISKLTDKVMEIDNYPDLSDMPKKINFNPEYDVCYIGYIGEESNLLPFIDLLDGSEVSLVLAGEFESRKYKRKIMNSPGIKNVTIKENPSFSEFKNLLSESKIGLYSYKADELKDAKFFPLQILFYMKYGMPIIVSDTQAWQTVMSEYKCGVCVNPIDPSEIKSSVDYILKGADVWENMAIKSMQTVSGFYSCESKNRELAALYTLLFPQKRSS